MRPARSNVPCRRPGAALRAACVTTAGVVAFLLFGAPSVTYASPIYVTKDRSGAIHFSSKPPPPGVRAEVFTARSNFSYYRGLGHRIDRLFLSEYTHLIREKARQYRVNESLVRAVIHVESAFNARAVSPKGAQGLMQLMPSRAELLGVKDPFLPEDNIDGGVRHLAALLRRYGSDLRRALAAYNAGEGAVDRYGGVPPFRETTEYVRKVIALETRYRRAARGTS